MAEQRTRFFGTYEPRLDEKGRMVLPARMRAQLGETGVLGKLDGCLGLWSLEGFEEAADQMAADTSGRVSSGALRQFTADAFEISPDQQGRIVIPARLRDYAQLGPVVAIIGRINRAEIWDLQVWNALSDTQDAELNEAVKAIGL